MFPSGRFPPRAPSPWLLLPLTAFLLLGCDRGPSPELLATRDSLSAIRDSLRSTTTERTLLIRDAASELAKVLPTDAPLQTRRGGAPRTPGDTLVARALLVTSRFAELRNETQTLRGRMGTLNRRVDSLGIAMESAVAVRDSTIRGQEMRISSLASEVSGLRSTEERLRQQVGALSDSVVAVLAGANRTYFRIGTKEELLRAGILSAVPGPRLLYLLWHQGESIVPARSLDPARFQAVDRREWTEIPLPEAGARYRVVSRQDLTATDASLDEKGWIRGSRIRITDPARFWRGSPFLILVRED